MYISFDKIDAKSRVWVYQSPRKFVGEELLYLNSVLASFCNTWTSHNHELQASYTITFNQFIVLAVNENVNDASGCSIDKSVHLINEISSKLNVDLLDKSNLYIVDGSSVTSIKLPQIKSKINAGELSQTTQIINTLVSTKSEFDSNFVTEANLTWVKKFFLN